MFKLKLQSSWVKSRKNLKIRKRTGKRDCYHGMEGECYSWCVVWLVTIFGGSRNSAALGPADRRVAHVKMSKCLRWRPFMTSKLTHAPCTCCPISLNPPSDPMKLLYTILPSFDIAVCMCVHLCVCEHVPHLCLKVQQSGGWFLRVNKLKILRSCVLNQHGSRTGFFPSHIEATFIKRGRQDINPLPCPPQIMLTSFTRCWVIRFSTDFPPHPLHTWWYF